MAKMSKADKAKTYDKLAGLLKRTSPERLEDVLTKTERVALRMTRTDKAKLDELVKKCGLTATELVTRLIDFAFETLKGK
ncbi:MAG TPA: hypothetical protein VKX17_14170 [Planctomycetota bacterium]|nr:hypothetical protein [Planctomycetota bacterium]